MNASSTAPAIRCAGLSKRFGAVQALHAADLTVAAGSIHAVAGENGAGKSTLMNLISGLLRPDAGSLEVFGRPASFASPLDAVGSGIGMVHQHFLLAEALSVAENVALGRRASPGGWRFPRRQAEEDLERLSAESGLRVDPRARVSDLGVGMRQRVEILKALTRGARILLLDEPTAVLAPPEVDQLFRTLETLRAAGRTLVLITHKLDQVFALASAVTVLRGGRTVFEGPLQGLSSDELARMIVGEASSAAAAAPAVRPGAAVLEVRALRVPAEHGTGLHGASFTLHAGEILGVAGVEGNGQDELAGALAGTRRAAAGSSARLCGAELLTQSVRSRAAAGVASIPGDRQREGLVLELSLAENLHLREAYEAEHAAELGGAWRLSPARMIARARGRLEAYGVTPPDPALPAGALSGGNQQKVIAARELSRGIKLVLASNPTRGLDVAAAAAVQRRLVAAAREAGAAVLLISSDLDEVLALSDRVGVLYGGTLTLLGSRGVSRDAVGAAMVGA